MKLKDLLKEESNLVKTLQSQGLSQHEADEKYSVIELEIGGEVELEHTRDKAAAREIAKDHLKEDPFYYSVGLSDAQKDVKEIAEKVVKKYGYKSLAEYRKKNK